MLLVAALAALAAGGCAKDSEKNAAAAATITDLAGRSVQVAAPAEKVCAIGPGALRLVCYVNGAARVVGIENMEKQWSGGRPYIQAFPKLLDLPVIGQGGPDSAPDPEALLSVKPDVVFAASLLDASRADELQEKTGIPVVVLSYGRLGTFDRELLDSIALVGRITGNEARASAVVTFIRQCRDDLGKRTAGIPPERRPTVYVGGVGMKGTHGIESTQAGFPPFAAINARNVVDETGQRGSVMIDKEQLLQWDPQFIFVDESGWSMVRKDYDANPGLYRSLRAVKGGRLYGYLPYNYYATNVDTAIADAYFMGIVVYPDAFQDVDPVAKAGEIYRFLLGEDAYGAMARDFGGFAKLSLAGS
jgi:iron complex transport system substrate-binding protein